MESCEQRLLLCDPTDNPFPAPVFSEAIELANQAKHAGHGSSDGGTGDATGVTLVWTNRGTATSDTDGFNGVFGTAIDPASGLTKAEEARKVIDQVFLDWGNAILSFNRTDNGVPGTTLQISVNMNTANKNNNAAASPAVVAPSDGMPRTGSVSINAGTDGHGAGYYLDPRPQDYTEFAGVTQNAFSAFPTTSQGADLYSLVSLEVTHVLGLIGPGAGTTNFAGYKFVTRGLASKTNVVDTAEGDGTGYFGIFNGPSIKHLLTTNNGGGSDNGGVDWGSLIHTAGAGGGFVVQSTDTHYQPITINGTVYYPDDDTGNAIYEASRILPNEVVLDMLHDAYGYTIKDPHTLPNVYAQLSASTHTLYVSGPIASSIANDPRGASDDVITVDQSGTTITVSVNAGYDTPGSGNLPGAGDLAPYVSTFDASQVNSIIIDGQGGNDTIVIRGIKPTIINGGDGNDNIRVRGIATGSGNTVSINGGNGNDSISFGSAFDDLNDLNNYATVNGGAGNDTIRFDDASEPYPDTYTLFGTYFARSSLSGQVSFDSAEYIYLDSGNGDSTFNVNAVPTGMRYEINAGGGVDTINVGNHDISGIFGTVVAHGGSNGDRITLDDLNATSGHSYTVNATTLQRTDRSTSLTFDGFGTVGVSGGSGADTFFVTPSNTTAFSINGNGPSTAPGDTLSLALANVTGASNAGSGGSGTWTFWNRQSVQYISIETQTSAGGNSAPTIGTLYVNPGTAVPGQLVGLMADPVSDADGNLSSVSFYRETNGVSGLQSGSDTLISTDAYSPDGWSTTMSTSGLASGVYTLYAQAIDAGNALSSAVTATLTIGASNQSPTIAGLQASPGSVTQGQSIGLSATGVTDADGAVLFVDFYRESNGIAGLQIGSDQLLIQDNYAGDGYGTAYSTASLGVGTYTFYAVATDNSSATSNVATANVVINAPGNQPPSINGGLFAIPNPVSVNGSFAILAGTVSDPDGVVVSVSFYKETNGVPGLQNNDTFVGIDTVSNDGWFVPNIFAGSTAGTFTYYAVATDNGGAQSAAVPTDIIVQASNPPAVVSSAFDYSVSPLKFNFAFDSDVSSSLGTGDLIVQNMATGAVVAVNSVTWNSANKTASFTLQGVPADGNYRAQLIGSGITNAAGTPMTANTVLNFFTLAGDANHDRTVNFADLVILAQNYNKTGKTFSQGNFNYSSDGKVDFADLVMFAQRYNTTLVAPTSLLAPAALTVATATKKKVAASRLDELN